MPELTLAPVVLRGSVPRCGAERVTSRPARGDGPAARGDAVCFKTTRVKVRGAVRRGTSVKEFDGGSSSGSVDSCSVDSSGARTGAGCTAARTERRQSFIM